MVTSVCDAADMSITEAVAKQVSDELGLYVYMLVDPRTGVPFYVGRGRGVRHAQHGVDALGIRGAEDAEEVSRKIATIAAIRDSGNEPGVWVLRYGLLASECAAVEAAAIDLLMSMRIKPARRAQRHPLGVAMQLTNARREKARGHGITTLESLVEEYAAPDLQTTTPLLLITLNGWVDFPDGQDIAGNRVRAGAGYRAEWLVSSVRRSAYREIGDSVSAWWSINPDEVTRCGIEHVAAVHRGVTRALFKIVPGSWETTAETFDKRGRPITKAAFRFRILRAGPLFDEVVGPYGHRVPGRARGARNAIYYWPR
jgi:hypothetical protein